jgi:hypothetical protein
MTKIRRAIIVVAAVSCLASGAAMEHSFEFSFEPKSFPMKALPPIPSTEVQLVLDDDTADGDFGVNSPNAQQFMWFNQFTPPATGVRVNEIWVLFPPSGTSNVSVGDQVEILVYLDPDGDPTTGATLLRSFSESVQAADGNLFSVYAVAPPLEISDPGDILIGVVDRWVESGVTAATRPAAIDVTSSQGRSWLAVWTGDPPPTPTLPADVIFSTVDSYQPGNWMIRAFGDRLIPPGIPSVSGFGLAMFVLLVCMAGVTLLYRS